MCILVFKIVDILYKEEQCREKYQKTATTLFVIGLIGIIISQAIFNKNNGSIVKTTTHEEIRGNKIK